MQKPKAHTKEWNKDIHEARETLTCQTLILEFLHFRKEYSEEIKPATQRTVQEFRNYLENKKDLLRERGQHFEEKREPNKDRVDEEIKYSKDEQKHKLIK